MALYPQVLSGLVSIGAIVTAMAVVAAVEAGVPLHPRDRWSGAHLGPNLTLTAVTFATNLLLNVALVMSLIRLQPTGFGLLHTIALPPLATGVLAVFALDFSFYVAHVSMHALPGFWRFHAVHHSDPVLDVTTTIRQHPGESVIRYAFMAVAAIGLGASPGAFAVYRVWSALNGLLEHANIRVPRRLDSLLSHVVTTPNMHKVHHSRRQPWTDTNYGNIFAVFDRLFSTFTPSANGVNVAYGLDGYDDAAAQTTAALLLMPFRGRGTKVALAAE